MKYLKFAAVNTVIAVMLFVRCGTAPTAAAQQPSVRITMLARMASALCRSR